MHPAPVVQLHRVWCDVSLLGSQHDLCSITWSAKHYKQVEIWGAGIGYCRWSGPVQYQDKESQELMMLPTDMWLIWDKQFKKYVEKYAEV